MSAQNHDDPVSLRRIQIYCQATYDLSVAVPFGRTALSGAQILAALQEHEYVGKLVHPSGNTFALSFVASDGQSRVDVKVPILELPHAATINDVTPWIDLEMVYPWVALTWIGQFSLRSNYGEATDASAPELPSAIDVAVKALRAASVPH